MKKLITVLMLLVSIPTFAQQGINYAVQTIEWIGSKDSTTINTYTKMSIEWQKEEGNTWFTGGNYTLYVYPDTFKSSAGVPVTNKNPRDTDSLLIYVKAKVPSTLTINAKTSIKNYEVVNDSLFITPLPTGLGLNFDLDKWYQFDFELPRCKGVDIYIKRRSLGAITFYYCLTK